MFTLDIKNGIPGEYHNFTKNYSYASKKCQTSTECCKVWQDIRKAII